MKNSEFKVGSHISVYGHKGIVVSIDRCLEFELSYDGKNLGTHCFNAKQALETAGRGYTLIATGRTATYFIVSFENDEYLKGTGYDNAEYGCLDEFSNYGTW